MELELPAVGVGEPVADRVAFARLGGTGLFDAVLAPRHRAPGGMHDVVVEPDDPSAGPQRVVADLQEAQQPGRGSGVVQQVHGHHQVRRPGFRIEVGDVPVEIRAAERVPRLLALGQADHLRRNVDPGDAGGAGPPEQAGVEAAAAGEVEHRGAPDVPQRLEQRVALDGLPERKLLRVPVRLGDGVVLGQVSPRRCGPRARAVQHASAGNGRQGGGGERAGRLPTGSTPWSKV